LGIAALTETAGAEFGAVHRLLVETRRSASPASTSAWSGRIPAQEAPQAAVAQGVGEIARVDVPLAIAFAGERQHGVGDNRLAE
jgi:hypothetical protein